jgi:hypothetical protein
MKKLAVALLLGALTIPVTFAAPQGSSPTQTESKGKKKHSKKKAEKKPETK